MIFNMIYLIKSRLSVKRQDLFNFEFSFIKIENLKMIEALK